MASCPYSAYLREPTRLLDLLAALHQQRAGAAGRIADLVAFLRLHQLGDQLGNFRRRVELAGLLAAGGGKVLDQEFVGVADDVELADAAGAQVQLGLGEIFQQVAQDVVLLRLVAELVGVEADVLEHVAQLADVGFLDGVQRLVDALAVAGLVPLLVQRVEAGDLAAARSARSSASPRSAPGGRRTRFL